MELYSWKIDFGEQDFFSARPLDGLNGLKSPPICSPLAWFGNTRLLLAVRVLAPDGRAGVLPTCLFPPSYKSLAIGSLPDFIRFPNDLLALADVYFTRPLADLLLPMKYRFPVLKSSRETPCPLCQPLVACQIRRGVQFASGRGN
jgi:hypothetical protein